MESNSIIRYRVLDALGIMAKVLGPIAAKIISERCIIPTENLTNAKDASQVLASMRSHWNEAFEPFFRYPESQRVRSLVYLVTNVRNTYEGHPNGDYSRADEALDDIRRLLEAFSAHEAARKVSELKIEVARLILNGPFTELPTPKVKIPGEVGPVERAIRQHCASGDVLRTPTGRKDFTITEINDAGIKFSKLGQTLISWAVIDDAVSTLRNAGGEAEIGGYNGWAKPGTFERFLQDARYNNTRTSTYVAPILVESYIAEYVPKPGAKRIRLTPQYMEPVQ